MTPFFNIHDVILLAEIYLCILFVLLIIASKKERQISDYFFAGFILTQTMIPIDTLINYCPPCNAFMKGVSLNSFEIFRVGFWLQGAFLLCYYQSLLFRNYQCSSKVLLLFLPALIFLIYIAVNFFILQPQQKVQFINSWRFSKQPTMHFYLSLFSMLYNTALGILCLKIIRQVRAKVKDHYSNAEDLYLNWLYLFSIALVIIWSWETIVIAISIISPNIDFEILNVMGLSKNYLMFCLISTLIFVTLKRSEFFTGITVHESNTDEQTIHEVDIEFIKRLETHMNIVKPYLACILNLDQLAKQLNVSPRALSNTINRHYQKNFFEFINQYRITEAKQQLSNPELCKKPIIEIIGDCGFNSKATFNTFFKKLTGTTPSKFRASQLK